MKNYLIAIMLIACLLLAYPFNISWASDETKPSTDTTVDSLLGALADMSVEEAKKVISLRFTREFRDKVCGLYRYGTGLYPDNEEDKFRYLFGHSCQYVTRKIERNIITKDLIEAFKKDMATNGVLLVKHAQDKIDRKLSGVKVEKLQYVKSTYEDLVAAREEMENKLDKYKKELLAINLLYLSWKEKPAKEIVLQALSESEEYEEYLKIISNLQATAEGINKLKGVVRNSIKITKIEVNAISGDYQVLQKEGQLLKLKQQKFKINLGRYAVEKVEAKMATLFLAVANSTDKVSFKQNSRDLLKTLINEKCKTDCSRSLNQLIDGETKNIFQTLSYIVDFKKKSYQKSFDVESVDRRHDKALRALNALSEFSSVKDRDSAKAVLTKYQTDENTRTVRYWEHSWSLGTLLGAASGKAKCDSCENKERSLPVSLYAPFGLFYTKGWFGAQLHVFDLGQYINDTDNNQDDQTTTWEDAVAPGFAIFIRKRSFPLTFGYDYTYKSDNDERDYREEQHRVFIAMELDLFSLN